MLQRDFVLYLRKSKGRAGIARQRRDCQRHADKIGARIVAEFIDTDATAYSAPGAARARRDDYTRMIAMLASDQSPVPLGVMAWHTDRLNRNTAVAEEFIEIAAGGGHPVETARAGSYDLSTPTGRKRFRQDAVDATYEVDHMVERIEAAKLEAASEGRWLGGRRPLGFETDGRTHRRAEAEAIDSGTTALLNGVSLNGVTRDWRDAGLTGSGGAELTAVQVRRILLRARNAGLMVHKGRVVGRAQWLPVLLAGEYAAAHDLVTGDERARVEDAWRAEAKERWRAVVALLKDPDRRTTPGPERRWLGSGIYRCGVDGCGLRLRMGTAGDGTRKGQAPRPSRPAYRCSGQDRHVVRDAEALDAYVCEAIVARLQMPDAAERLAPEPAEDTTRLRVELVELRGRLDELAAAFGEGDIDARQLREGSRDLRARVAGLEERIAATVPVTALEGLLGVPDVPERWEALLLGRRRAVLSALLEVTVLPASKGRPPGWRPGRPYFSEDFVRLVWWHR